MSHNEHLNQTSFAERVFASISEADLADVRLATAEICLFANKRHANDGFRWLIARQLSGFDEFEPVTLNGCPCLLQFHFQR